MQVRHLAISFGLLLLLTPGLLIYGEAGSPTPEIRPHPSFEADLHRLRNGFEIGRGKAYVGKRAARFEIAEGEKPGAWIITLPGNMWARVNSVSQDCQSGKQDDEIFLMFNRHDTYAEECEPGGLIDGHPTERCSVKGIYWGLEPEAYIWKAADLAGAVVRAVNRKEKDAPGYELRNIQIKEPETSLFTCPAAASQAGKSWRKTVVALKPALKFWYVPIVFFIAFQFFMSFASGWRRLVEKYGVDATPKEKVCSPSMARMGIWSYFYVLKLRATPGGLHFSVSLALRPSHSPFLIPWSEMHPVGEFTTLRRVWVEMTVGHPAVATIMIPKEIYEKGNAHRGTRT